MLYTIFSFVDKYLNLSSYFTEEEKPFKKPDAYKNVNASSIKQI